MAKESRSRKDRTSPLRPEDARLWEKVARTATPLRRGRKRVGKDSEPAGEGEISPPEKPSGARDGKSAEQETTRRPQAPAAEPPPPPPLGGFDRREARQLGSGRLAVGARIDLHGMRQREAHAALRAFLARAHAQGHRHVLVITGKGGIRTADEPDARPPGVLKREVPRWLEEPAFRQWVVGYTQAALRHGGEGALYVRLRKSRSIKE